MPQALSIIVLQNPINCLVFESTLWFSQRAIAKIFGSTRQNISLHASDLGYDGTEAISRNFDIQQREGHRIIRRSLVHYDIKVLAAIALRSRRYDIHEELLKIATAYKVSIDQVPIRPKKERNFQELLFGVLDGITQIIPQHRFGKYYADFYLPDIRLVIEYDESHHAKPKIKGNDKTRQDQIEKIFKVSFIRVGPNEEISALNQVLKMVINIRGLDTNNLR